MYSRPKQKFSFRVSILTCTILILGVFGAVPQASANVFANGDYNWIYQIGDDGDYLLDENNQRVLSSGYARVENDTIIHCNYCSGIIDIPEGIVGISGGAFNYTGIAPYTGQIRGIDIPNSISAIDQNDFLGATSLRLIKFKNGNNPLTIGDNAFFISNFQALESIEIPGRTVSIGSGALKRLVSVTFEEGSSPLDIGANAALNNTYLTRITIPARVTSLGDSAFSGNSALRILNIESGTTQLSIGKSTFANTPALFAVTLPQRLTSIGEDVFKDSGIAQVTFLGSAPIVETSTSSATLSNGATTGYVDANFAASFTPANPDWYGLSIVNGRGAAGPSPTISLISPDVSLQGSKGGLFNDYQLEIQSSDPYTVTVISGSLPPGLSVNTSGRISGTPTAGGAYNATIQVTDEYGSGSVTVPISIFESPIALQKVSSVQNPRNFVNVGSLTFFSSNSSLWVTDGSETGTRVIGSIDQPIYSGVSSITRVTGGVVFQALDNDDDLPAFYFSNGSNGEPEKIPANVAPRSSQSVVTFYQNRLYYLNADSYLQCTDLDGNSCSVPSIRFPDVLKPSGNRMYYTFENNEGGSNLMYLNLATNNVETVTVGLTSTENYPKFNLVRNLTQLNGGILLRTFDGSYYEELWFIAENSSVMVNVAPNVAYNFVSPIMESDSRCNNSDCPFLTYEGNAYFFTGVELWKTNGITSTLVKFIDEYDSDVYGIWYGGNLYFTFAIDERGSELQQYNPLTDAITGISDIYPGSSNSSINELGASETALFFNARDASDERNLWISGSASDSEQESEPEVSIRPSSQEPSIPDPVQKSTILQFELKVTDSGTARIVTILGTFTESIKSIHVNGKVISPDSWSQAPTRLSIKFPLGTVGQYSIQIFNGAVPVLPAQLVTFSAPVVKTEAPKPIEPAPVVTPTPAPSPKPTPSTPAKTPSKVKAITIKCVKGKTVKTVKGTKPKCPKGYVKK
jgi:hypothetical protein